MATEQEIREVKHRHSSRLLNQPGVSGVGIERDEQGNYVLAVHLADPDARKQLPDEIEGHPVKYIHTGPYRKLPADDQA
ncbi:MAG: hypothetical protein DMF64_15585 [Acidobacteria bacterium]|nr:MAG: hypothetical protein DMF64_15585 [Acidobacteriota bacterium]